MLLDKSEKNPQKSSFYLKVQEEVNIGFKKNHTFSDVLFLRIYFTYYADMLLHLWTVQIM